MLILPYILLNILSPELCVVKENKVYDFNTLLKILMDFALSANMKWYNREVLKLCLQRLDLKKKSVWNNKFLRLSHKKVQKISTIRELTYHLTFSLYGWHMLYTNVILIFILILNFVLSLNISSSTLQI